MKYTVVDLRRSVGAGLPPIDQNLFDFMRFLRKNIKKNIRWAPPFEGLALPPTTGPGSTSDMCVFSTL